MMSNPSSLKDGCLLTLHYFGIFRYPLSLLEIHRFNKVPGTLREVQQALNELVNEGRIYRSGGFYLAENKEDWVSERIKGNAKAIRLLVKAGRYVSVIAAFPYVRGVAISGSLSKNYAGEITDFDYFIITAADRLWISRSLLHLFKKLTFITGHQHCFCMNYFVDTTSLKITHRNIYSSIEVVTLLPAYNDGVLEQFFEANQWTVEFLPNDPGIINYKYLENKHRYHLKAFLEKTIDLFFPSTLNRALMQLTNWKWKRKWRKRGYPDQDYASAILTDVHISKNHPVDYEKKVLTSLVEYQSLVQQNH